MMTPWPREGGRPRDGGRQREGGKGVLSRARGRDGGRHTQAPFLGRRRAWRACRLPRRASFRAALDAACAQPASDLRRPTATRRPRCTPRPRRRGASGRARNNPDLGIIPPTLPRNNYKAPSSERRFLRLSHPISAHDAGGLYHCVPPSRGIIARRRRL